MSRRWKWVWIAWLSALVVLEVLAARSRGPKPRTLTEHLAGWFRKKWRWVLVGLMALLTWHFAMAPDVRPVEVVW